jgi:hypothetical protein
LSRRTNTAGSYVPSVAGMTPERLETWIAESLPFYELPTGERHLHFGVRATPRVD